MAAGSKKKAKVIEGSVVETPESEFESASCAETFTAAPVAAVAETFAAAPVTALVETPEYSVVETPESASSVDTFAAAPVTALAAVAETLPEAPVAALAEGPKLYETPAASLGDLQERVRSLIETGINERRVRYAKVKSAADEAAHALEASYSSAKHGAVEISVKAFGALRATADANFDFVKAALGAKTASDYVAVHGEFARKQIDMLTSQTKAMGELAQKVAAETMEPIKAQVVKTLRLPS
jgi:phasin